MDVFISFIGNQRADGFCCTVFCLDLYGNQRVCRSDKEILLQRRILPLVVIELISGLDKSLTYDVFVERALIDTKIFVRPQVLLRFLVQHSDQKATVRKVDFVLGFIIVPLQRQLRELQAVADVDHTGIVQPLDTAPIVAEPRTGCHLGDLEFFIILCQLNRYMVEYIQYPRLVNALRILTDIFSVVSNELPLDVQRPLKCTLSNKFPYNSGHSA